MGVNWTKEQQKVIDLRNRNILVSAAAGSGKTAVLVERIIKMLTDEENPVDVDRLLIVTFTEAAASEMKERILNAIEKALEENPENAHLQRQATLIHSSLITTIHSFCLSVIREHFHVLDIDPGFRIAEDGELTLLKQDVLENMLEDYYVEGDIKFLEFTEKYSSGKNDKKIEELILKLYDYSRSYPQADKWLDECLDAYKGLDEDNNIIDMLIESAKEKCEDIILMNDECMKICELPAGPYMYAEAVEDDRNVIEKIAACDKYDDYYEALKNVKWKRLSTKKDESVYVELKEKVKKIRDNIKGMIKDLSGKYFYSSFEDIESELINTADSVEVLITLVKEFGERFAKEKQKKNMIDFGDMEQFALRILNEEKEGSLVPSAIAREYQDRFYEVMIDEYQDSNFIQETILTSVSKVSRGTNNVFMVGDVKQSIYRFRLSRPELFMEKYDTYSLEDGDKQRIDLDKNFRSRKEVLESVNFIFRQIMRKGLGNVEYDKPAFLNPGASFEDQFDENGVSINNAELILINNDPELDSTEEEAFVISQRIKKLMQSGKILDKKTGEYRKPMYKDIVILIRSAKKVAPVFSKVLADEGIPLYFGSSEGYFEAYEVGILLDYLKVLDNYRQDIPLTAVLTSVFGEVTAVELGKIKEEFSEVCYHDAIRMYISKCESEENMNESLYVKLKNFMDRFDYFRSIVPFTPIDKLLTYIIEETGYKVYMASMPGGLKRAANIDMLVEKASAFEKTSYKGLFNFVRYINQIRKYDVDYGEAGVDDENSDTVRLMTIHKSKGLEFPIVFVSSMGRNFNTRDQRSSMVIHPTLGVGLDSIDLEKRTKAPVILKKLIQDETLKENLGEELRVLYVALTRAKEKLIMTGVLKDATEVVEEEENRNDNKSIEPLGYYQLSKAQCYLDWIVPLIGRITKDIPMEYVVVGAVGHEDEEESREYDMFSRNDVENLDTNTVYNECLKDKLENELGFNYSYKTDGKCKMKFTVSELKKMQYEKEILDSTVPDSNDNMFAGDDMDHIIPEFMKEDKTLRGSDRGTAYHRFMELHDFTKKSDFRFVKEELENYLKDGFMTEDMARCIYIKDILNFLDSSSGQRMLDAALKGKLKKEQPFIMVMDAGDVYDDMKDQNENILVQGVVDVCFEEDEEIVVLDYKTDNVNDISELKTRYHAQLDLYGKAIEKLTGKHVKEKIIYSFKLNETIRIH